MSSSLSCSKGPPPASTNSSSSSSPDNVRPSTNNRTSASLVENQQDSSESFESLEEYFVKQQKGIRTIVAMSIGLDNGRKGKFGEDMFENDDRFPQQLNKRRSNKQNKDQPKKWKPSVNILVGEIKRRKKEYYKSNKGSSEMKKDKAFEWLIEHPINFSSHIKWVLKKINEFFDATAAAKKEVIDTRRDQWHGVVPFLRMIHCIFDFDDIRAALQKSFTVMTRTEIDGRYDDDHARDNPWEMIAEKWNDPEYNIKTSVYGHLHNDYRQTIDLSHSKVAGMGTLTPDKAKKKFYKLKNEMVIVKMKWERSGNGDGSFLEENAKEIDLEARSLINGSDMVNFLGGASSSVLYLWKKAQETDFVSAVCQQLDINSSLDTERSGNVCTELVSPVQVRKKVKMERKKDEEEKQRSEQRMEKVIAEGNEMLKESTLEIKKSNEHHAEANKEKALLRKQQMAIDLVSRIKACEEKIEMLEDKLDDMVQTKLSHKYRRFQERKKRAEDELEELKKTLEQYE